MYEIVFKCCQVLIQKSKKNQSDCDCGLDWDKQNPAAEHLQYYIINTVGFPILYKKSFKFGVWSLLVYTII